MIASCHIEILHINPVKKFVKTDEAEYSAPIINVKDVLKSMK